MSWSFYAVGKPAAVLAKARVEFGKIHCSEPEETIKGKVLNILEASLLAMAECTAVKIEAAGSQSPGYVSSDGGYKAAEGKFSNNLTLKIEPIFGFVE